MIRKILENYSLDTKTRITFALVNSLPFVKPDSLLHTNFNSAEISHCLSLHQIPLTDDLKTLDNITVYIDRVYKIFNVESNLVGMPYPEAQFLRIRVNLKSF